MSVCFFCGREFRISTGIVLGRTACRSCYTTHPIEMHWEIHREAKKIGKRHHHHIKHEAELKTKAAEEARERRAENEGLSVSEMLSEELEEYSRAVSERLAELRRLNKKGAIEYFEPEKR